jgi:polo-like kinase 1
VAIEVHADHNSYTMLVGKPPFQTKDVKAIYKRIKENRYDFPADKPISSSARDLITTILNPDPGKFLHASSKLDHLADMPIERRPDAETILRHPFFFDGPFPDRIPALAHDTPPDFRYLSGSASRHNFKQACRRANVGVALPAYVEKPLVRTALGPSIYQQQREFQDAVQPDSPISKLLQCVSLYILTHSRILI